MLETTVAVGVNNRGQRLTGRTLLDGRACFGVCDQIEDIMEPWLPLRPAVQRNGCPNPRKTGLPCGFYRAGIIIIPAL